MKRWVLVICCALLASGMALLLWVGDQPPENITPLRWIFGICAFTSVAAFLWPWLVDFGLTQYPQELRPLVKNLRLTAVSNFGIGILMLAFAWVIFGVIFLGWDPSFYEQTRGLLVAEVLVLVLLLLAVAGLGVFLLKRTVGLIRIRQSKIFRALFDAPDTIVWLYEMTASTRHVQGSVQRFVMVRFNDGSAEQIVCGSKIDTMAVMTCMLQYAPHAVLGYQADWEKRYLENPAAFRR